MQPGQDPARGRGAHLWGRMVFVLPVTCAMGARGASQPSVGTILSAPRSWCCTNVFSESASADWTPWVYLVAVQGLEATPQAARTVSVSQNKGAGVEAELALKPSYGPEGEEVLL